MPLIETATTYLLDLLVKNEAIKKFPQDFVTESVKWVRYGWNDRNLQPFQSKKFTLFL